MAAARKSRREFDQIETLVRLGAAGAILLALAVGGLANFLPALGAVLVLVLALALAVMGLVLVIKSRLMIWHKIGAVFLIAAIVTCGLWMLRRAPRQWPQVQARVMSVDGPPAETTTTYSYRPSELRKEGSFLTRQTKAWKRLGEARQFKPAPLAVYYDPFDPTDVRSEPCKGCGRVVANPIPPVQIRVTGIGTATLRVENGFLSKTVSVTGPLVAEYSVGKTLPIYQNPVNDVEMSVSPRATEGGQQYDILASSIALGLGGLLLVVFGNRLPTPLNVATSSEFQRHFGQPASRVASTELHSQKQATQPPILSIAERLAGIDWFQFEAVTARILRAEGWSVVMSGGANPDGGADLIATRAGRKAVVQCKYWRGVLVQPKIIRELIGTKASAQFRADEAILFTYSACTEAALACAEENGVVIRNANSIEETIRHLGIDRFPELLNPEKKLCPKCGSAMVLREGPEKTFWGCSKFGITRCRGVIECYATVPVLVLDRNFEPSNFKGDCKSEIIGNRCP